MDTKKLLYLVLLTGIMIMFAVSCTSASDAVVFSDPKLEAAVRKAVDKPEGKLTANDLELLEELTCLGKGVTSLDGLEHAVNLRSLNLRRNQIDNIGPLEALTGLEELNLADNRVTDISPLNNLTALKRLELDINLVKDITVVDWTNLRQLRYIDLRFNYLDLDAPSVAQIINMLIETGIELRYEPMY